MTYHEQKWVTPQNHKNYEIDVKIEKWVGQIQATLKLPNFQKWGRLRHPQVT